MCVGFGVVVGKCSFTNHRDLNNVKYQWDVAILIECLLTRLYTL